MTLKRFLVALVAACCIAVAADSVRAQAAAQSPLQAQSAQQQQQNEFVPLDQLPPQEQLPAGRLLIVAYAFVVGALFVYIVSLSRRLTSVRREVERLEADLKRSGRA
jgi:CcmD family protein